MAMRQHLRIGGSRVVSAGIALVCGVVLQACESEETTELLSYEVGGTVSGLQGGGLVLELNRRFTAEVSASGAFTFADLLPDGAPFEVRVRAQPRQPAQRCDVEGGTGFIDGAAITGVAVSCVTETFTVGGSVLGLVGTGLELALGDEVLPIDQNGPFTFATPLADLSPYEVTLAGQPTEPDQTCTLRGGAGTLASANVVNVAVRCENNATAVERYTVGGSVSGLEGSGLQLELASPAGTDVVSLDLTTDGPFTFPGDLVDGSTYAVTIARQPSLPAQRCSLAGDSGTLDGANATSVAVTCVTPDYTVGGRVLGLAGTGLALTITGGETLSISADGPFTFTTAFSEGSTYAVNIDAQPTGPSQRCELSAAEGVVGRADVSSIRVRCQTRRFSIGGSTSGLLGSGLGLELRTGAGAALRERIDIAANGPFFFAEPVTDGDSYELRLSGQPADPRQICTLGGAAGTVAGADIANVSLTCVTEQFAVGGTIEGLVGSGLELTLESPGLEPETLEPGLAANFAFTTALDDGSAFVVRVSAQPTAPSQRCVATAAAGILAGGDFDLVQIRCETNRYTVGGRVTGLEGSGLTVTLSSEGGDDETVALDGNGRFEFDRELEDLRSYAVAIAGQPTEPEQICAITSGEGAIDADDVDDIRVSCETVRFSVGGGLTGLTGTGLELGLLDAEGQPASSVAPPGDGPFTFPDPLPDGSAFTLEIGTQPTDPIQTCTVAPDAGVLAGGDASGFAVTCVTEAFRVAGTVSGLEGAGLRLALTTLDETLDSVVEVSEDGAFEFPDLPLDGSALRFEVIGQPAEPMQRCAFERATATVAGAAIEDLAVTCVTQRFQVLGAVAGLAGTGLRLRLGSGEVSEELALDSDGAFALESLLLDQSAYEVRIVGQPTAPVQTCSITAGVDGQIAGADADTLRLECTTERFDLDLRIVGLSGGELAVAVNGGEPLTFDENGRETLATLDDLSAYTVTLEESPAAPPQQCTLDAASATGALAGAPAVVRIDCEGRWSVGGAVTGLLGSGLELALNGGEPLAIGEDGAFTFSGLGLGGERYDAGVTAQPTEPRQVCTLSRGQGVFGAANVTDLAVTCVSETFSVGVTVAGLRDGGLELSLNGEQSLEPPGDGDFAFASALPDASAFDVTIEAQPEGDVCALVAPAGTLSGADASVSVVCSPRRYTVGGTLRGAADVGTLLQLNFGEILQVDDNGAFTFTTDFEDGVVVEVAPVASPVGQACTVESGRRLIAGTSITDIDVLCASDTYEVSGAITGLGGGTLTLLLNGDERLDVEADGNYFFNRQLADGATYVVEVIGHPEAPVQTCLPFLQTGIVAGAAVTLAPMSCVSEFAVQASVGGYAGSGLRLRLEHGGGSEEVDVAPGATDVSFSETVGDTVEYRVSVVAQPASPAQLCSVSGAVGSIAGADVTAGIDVTCADALFTVGGRVEDFGVENGCLALSLAGDPETFEACPGSTFLRPGPGLPEGTAYTLEVDDSGLTGAWTCEASGATGIIGAADVEDIVVSCERTRRSFPIDASGLIGSGLLLRLTTGGEEQLLEVDAAQADLSITPGVPDGAAWTLDIALQPSEPPSRCSLSATAGVAEAEVLDTVTVSCDAALLPLAIQVEGLLGDEVVVRYDGRDHFLGENGSYDSGQLYPPADEGALEVIAQPASPPQRCEETGLNVGAESAVLTLTCELDLYTVGGSVEGLSSEGLELLMNGASFLTLEAEATAFTFSEPLPPGATFEVEVSRQPAGQHCTFQAATGTLAAEDFEGLRVICADEARTLTVSLFGLLGGEVALGSSDGQTLTFDSDGEQSFAEPLAEGTPFLVEVRVQPTAPAQLCEFAANAGVVSTADLTLTLVCERIPFRIGVEVFGLDGPGLVLGLADTEQTLSPETDGESFFAEGRPDLSPYEVTLVATPEGQDCALGFPSGDLAGEDATATRVWCAEQSYTVGGQLSGFVGGTLRIRLNGRDEVELTRAGFFVFPEAWPDGATLTLEIVENATDPPQDCVVPEVPPQIEGVPFLGLDIGCGGPAE